MPQLSETRTAYGPNSPLIRRFLQRLASLPADMEREVAGRHRALCVLQEFASADLALGLLVAQAGRETECDALAGPLLLLVRERGAAALTDDTAEPVLRAIAEPALAALLALLMRDLLAPGDFSALYEPFELAIPFATLN